MPRFSGSHASHHHAEHQKTCSQTAVGSFRTFMGCAAQSTRPITMQNIKKLIRKQRLDPFEPSWPRRPKRRGSKMRQRQPQRKSQPTTTSSDQEEHCVQLDLCLRLTPSSPTNSAPRRSGDSEQRLSSDNWRERNGREVRREWRVDPNEYQRLW